MSVYENLQTIEQEILEVCAKSNRKRTDITIIGVTKYVTVERAQETINSGIIHLGESRDNGMVDKHSVIGDKAIWHYIGTLQSKKVKNVINIASYIHSLDRISLAKEINKRAETVIKCFVQVNTSQEESKHGLNPEEVISFIEEVRKFSKIEIVGLMTMAPYTEDESVIRQCFRDLKLLQQDVQSLKLQHAPCKELSMGMSNDFQIAIEEGATYIRIGSRLVGNES
ncbi:YggS family pyridoxal phosphate-dependent enzyme [Bacillus sp. HMF5848]|uniref:YggS family pyridoxal phosphate-dependent enzyme n=1 Tax=Bacillus sp. HMF5848 TaxID=2495421 RepID=UPI000F77BA8A|nr:YggS family pyridoxal phosphate-dependent enzyme [Bacillus sp. HMF5848]RSK26953.1 YggS family pyridoxal phosphate-dependent enzyme [Bacillus sp. HMF5848]